MMTKPELELLVGAAEVDKITLMVATEVVAMQLHAQMSPTSYLTLTPEQRNTSRRRANALVNEALLFWESEMRKRKALQ